jgi:hypothetical protein
MTIRSSTYPLRLPVSLKEALEKIAAEDGTSMNQFIVTAVAEKIAVLKTAEYFARRRARADLEAFDRFLSREGGAPPRPDDEVPEDLRDAVARLRTFCSEA